MLFMVMARAIALAALVVLGGTLVFRLFRLPTTADENPEGLDPVELVGKQMESGEPGHFVTDELVGVPFRTELRSFLKRHRLLVSLVLIALVVALVLSNACGLPASPLADNPKIMAAQEQVPYRLVLPRYLPEGWELSKVHVDKPPMENALASVTLFFGGDKKWSYMEISETEGNVHLSDPVQTVELSPTVEGQIQEIESNHPNWQGGKLLALSFNLKRANVGITIMASLEESEIVEIAQSMLPE